MRSNTSKPTVLYLDDEVQNLETFSANFRRKYHVITTDSPIEAYNFLQDGGVDIVIADQNMPAMSGIEFLETVANEFPEAERVLLTGYTEMVSVVEAVNKGKLFRILTKPFNLEEISKVIADASKMISARIETNDTIETLRRQNQQFEFLLRQRLLS